MKKTQKFTLVELVVVITIIAILAGLLIPLAIIGQQKARITQAKAEMATLLSAIKMVDSTYGRLPNDIDYEITSDTAARLNGVAQATGSNKLCRLDDESAVTANTSEVMAVRFGGNGANDQMLGGRKNGSAWGTGSRGAEEGLNIYDAFIMEMTDPGNATFFTNSGTQRMFNMRRTKLLDARSEYNPKATSSDFMTQNQDTLWRDPWGNPYVILLSSNGKEEIPHPAYKDMITDKEKTFLSPVLIYSFGPNGVDDCGINIANEDDRSRIVSTIMEDHYGDADDVVSW